MRGRGMVQTEERDDPLAGGAAPMRGTNQSGMRAYNEKLILTLRTPYRADRVEPLAKELGSLA